MLPLKTKRVLMHAAPSAVLLLTLVAAPAIAQDETCLACHGDKGLKSEAGRSIFVDPAKHKASVHGALG